LGLGAILVFSALEVFLECTINPHLTFDLYTDHLCRDVDAIKALYTYIQTYIHT